MKLRLAASTLLLSMVGFIGLPVALSAASPPAAKIAWVEGKKPLTIEQAMALAKGQGSLITDFTSVVTLDKPKQPTTAALLIDGAMLHLLIESSESTGELITKTTQPGGPAFRDDSIEFFIRAHQDKASYLQVISNAIGMVANNAYAQGGFVRSRDWQSGATVQKAKSPHGWSILVSIPLANLQLDPSLDEWFVQIARNRPPREGEVFHTATWPSAPEGLQSPASFGAVRLPKQFRKERFGWTLTPGEVTITRTASGMALEQKLQVTNKTPRYQTIRIASHLDEAGTGTVELGLPTGKGRMITTSTPLGEVSHAQGNLEQRLSIMDAPDETLASAMTKIDVIYEPAKLVLDNPGYRSVIFESQKMHTIEARLLHIDRMTSIEALKAELRCEDGEVLPGKVATRHQEGGREAWRLTVDGVEKLAPGAHQLVVSFKTERGPVEISRRIRKLPYRPGVTWIDPLGLLRREGKPQPAYGFLFGYWWNYTPERRLPGMFFNFAGPLYVPPPFKKLADLPALKKNLQSDDLLMVLNVPSASRTGNTRSLGNTPLTPKERKEYEAIIKAVGDNPRVFAWYLCDEPEIKGLGPERMKEIYNIFLENDPWRPVIVLNAFVDSTRNYQYGADISNPDPYPLFLEGRGAAKTLNYIGSFLDQIRLGEDSFRARWVTPQAFDYSYYGRLGNRGPTAGEMRTQQVIALIHGATGVTWYPEYLAWDEPGVTASLPYLSQEYRALFPHLVEAAPEVLPADDGLEAGILQNDQGVLLLLANPFWETRRFVVNDPRVVSHPRWKKLGTAGELAVEGKQLAFELAPHESMILASPGFPFPDELNWQAVEAHEQRLLQEAIVPGNLAHRSTGTVVRLTGDLGKPSPMPILVDGMKDPRGNGWVRRSFEAPEGFEFEFTKSARPQQLQVWSSNIKEAEVQLEVNGEWREVARMKNSEAAHVQKVSWNTEEVRKLRFIVHEVMDPDEALRIGEIEIYE